MRIKYSLNTFNYFISFFIYFLFFILASTSSAEDIDCNNFLFRGSVNIGTTNIPYNDCILPDDLVDPIDISLTFLSKPIGSSAIIYQSPFPMDMAYFRPDLIGEYIVNLAYADALGKTGNLNLKYRILDSLYFGNLATSTASHLSFPSISSGMVTVTGSNDISTLLYNGLSIAGGGYYLIDPGETITFSFEQPIQEFFITGGAFSAVINVHTEVFDENNILLGQSDFELLPSLRHTDITDLIAKNKVYKISITVTGGTFRINQITFGQSAPDEETNTKPVIQEIGNKDILEDSLLEFVIIATDGDGDNLTFSASDIPAGAEFNAATGTFSWTPSFTQSGSYQVLFSVTDDGNPPMGDTKEITITVGNVNRPPQINDIGPQRVNEGERVSFTVGAHDPDGDALILSVGNMPYGSEFNQDSGEFSWSPAFDQQGNYLLTFSASDIEKTISQQVTITVNNINRPPVLDKIGNRIVNEGELLEFVVTATDPDGNPMIFSANNLPSGAVFNPVLQKFTWTPTFEQAGNYTDVEFTVTDSPENGETIELDSELITITVGNINRAPVFVPIGTQTGQEGQTLTFEVSATDADGDDIDYTCYQLPLGATFSENQLNWTPTLSQSGMYNVTFTATDTGTPALSSQLNVIISIGDVPTPCEMSAKIVSSIESYNLAKAVENSYMANLKKVCPFVESGKFGPAINQLNAFTQKVNQDAAHGIISGAVGDTLVEMAENLVEKLQ